MTADSDKTYGPANTEFLHHQTYENSGTLVSNGGILVRIGNSRRPVPLEGGRNELSGAIDRDRIYFYFRSRIPG